MKVQTSLFSCLPKTQNTISKCSTDLASPLAGDQQLVTQALEILDTLTTYSKRVREQILLKPPEFVIDSRPSSSLDVHQNPASLNSSLKDDSGSEVEKIANKVTIKEKNPNVYFGGGVTQTDVFAETGC